MAAVSQPMPKRKPLPPGEDDSDKKTTMKVSVRILRLARMVAEYRGIDLFDYTEQVLGPICERDYRAFLDAEKKRVDRDG